MIAVKVYFCLVLLLIFSGPWIFQEVARSDLGFFKVSEAFGTILSSLRENLTLTFVNFCLSFFKVML